MSGRDDQNPNIHDPPPSETDNDAASRAIGSERQQVMGAQVAGAIRFYIGTRAKIANNAVV